MKEINYSPISVEKVDWTACKEVLREIRRQVFVEERRVAQYQEQDDVDARAQHWLAYSQDNQPIGAARMLVRGETGIVSRIAVLAPYRRQGVGTTLLRMMIQVAGVNDLEQLAINAQHEAEAFYRKFGFVRKGDLQEEDGAACIPMFLDLYRFSIKRGDAPEGEFVAGTQAFIEKLQKMSVAAERRIRIFTRELPVAIYNDAAICRALYQFAISRPQTEVSVLVRDLYTVKSNTPGLVELARKLPSRVAIRKCQDDSQTSYSDFAIRDKMSVLYAQQEDQFAGYFLPNARVRATEFANEFDTLWENSLPDPELRQLSL